MIKGEKQITLRVSEEVYGALQELSNKSRLAIQTLVVRLKKLLEEQEEKTGLSKNQLIVEACKKLINDLNQKTERMQREGANHDENRDQKSFN